MVVSSVAGGELGGEVSPLGGRQLVVPSGALFHRILISSGAAVLTQSSRLWPVEGPPRDEAARCRTSPVPPPASTITVHSFDTSAVPQPGVLVTTT